MTPKEICAAIEETYEQLDDLCKQRDRLVHALAEMRFAYVNGDQENPHDYEETAYRQAEEILTGYGKAWLTWENFRKMYEKP